MRAVGLLLLIGSTMLLGLSLNLVRLEKQVSGTPESGLAFVERSRSKQLQTYNRWLPAWRKLALLASATWVLGLILWIASAITD